MKVDYVEQPNHFLFLRWSEKMAGRLRELEQLSQGDIHSLNTNDFATLVTLQACASDAPLTMNSLVDVILRREPVGGWLTTVDDTTTRKQWMLVLRHVISDLKTPMALADAGADPLS